MPAIYIFPIVILLAILGYTAGKRRSLAQYGDRTAGESYAPRGYFGMYVALWCGIPALILSVAWLIFEPVIVNGLVLSGLPDAFTEGLSGDQIALLESEIENLSSGVVFGQPTPEVMAAAERYGELRQIARAAMFTAVIAIGLGAMSFAYSRVRPSLRVRERVEGTIMVILVLCSIVAILTTIGIVLSLFIESLLFFEQVSPLDFLFGLNWEPQTAIRADQVAAAGSFGAVPVFAGTLLISAIAMLVAVPIGLMSAIYLAEYAPSAVRSAAKPVVEMLAGIPTIVYGFFAVLTIAPLFREMGVTLGLNVAANSALAAGVVMGVMIIPFVSSLSDDAITAVPRSLRDGAAALGSTRSETIVQVIFPAALPGIVGGVLLATSRAIGETMIVVMAAGLTANLTANPFEGVTTVTVQIVTLLIGDTAFDSPKTLSAFALGLVLFLITLCLNIVALRITQKYREKYD